MKETCKIELVVERNLEWAFGRQGDYGNQIVFTLLLFLLYF